MWSSSGASLSSSPLSTTRRVAISVAFCMWGATAFAADATPTNEAADTGVMQEVTVTANRREESLSKVPISVSAYTQEAMDLKGIKDIDDVARYTPGVRVDNSQTNQISIRGISSTGGSGTTGIYTDTCRSRGRVRGST